MTLKEQATKEKINRKDKLDFLNYFCTSKDTINEKTTHRFQDNICKSYQIGNLCNAARKIRITLSSNSTLGYLPKRIEKRNSNTYPTTLTAALFKIIKCGNNLYTHPVMTGQTKCDIFREWNIIQLQNRVNSDTCHKWMNP